MTVLDAYAVIAYLRDEAAAGQVAALLAAGACTVTPVGLAEIVDVMTRVHGAEPDDLALDLHELGLLDAVPLGAGDGLLAGGLRARHYHRSRRAVSLADCVAAVAARSSGEPLATADPHLLDLCRDESVDIVALPGADGSRWTS